MRLAIPRLDCAGCTACCTIVPFSDADKAALTARKPFLAWERNPEGPGWIITQARLTGRCPFIGPGGCTIHGTPDYPAICRVYGVTDHPQLRCAIGKRPKQPLTHDQAQEVLRADKEPRP